MFPPGDSHFSGSQLTFRGEVEVPADGLFELVLVHDGKEIDVISDIQNNTWKVRDLDLSVGSFSELLLRATNTLSNLSVEIPIILNRNAFTVRMTDIVGDEDDVLISDALLKAIVRIDPASGERVIVSGDGVGQGPLFAVPAHLALRGDVIYLLDVDAQSLFEVSAINGDRRIVSGPEIGSGPQLDRPRIFELVGNTALVADVGLDALVSIDLDSGERTILFREFVEDGPVILSPQDMVILADGRILLIDDLYRALIEIDLSVGTFGVISNADRGDGPGLRGPIGLIIDNNGSVILLDTAFDALLRIDLSTGDRSVLNHVVDLGSEFSVPIAITAAGDRLYIADNGVGKIIEIENESRRLVTEVSQGQGKRLSSPYDILKQGEKFLISDRASDELLSIDPHTGDREVRFKGVDGVPFFSPDYLHYSDVRNQLFLTFSEFDEHGVMSIDLESGKREILASPQTGTGPLIILPRSIAYLEEKNSLLIFDAFAQRLIEIDIASKQRSIISDRQHGSGDQFEAVSSFAYDALYKTVYLLDTETSRIFSVDIETGDRTLLLRASPDQLLVDIEIIEDELILLDSANSALISFSLKTGNTSILSGESNGQGMLFDHAVNFSLLPEDNLAVVVDAGLAVVFLVDMVSGDRVVLSK